MRYLIFILLISSCTSKSNKYLQVHEVKPAKPIIKNGPLFFTDSTFVAVSKSPIATNDASNYQETTYYDKSQTLMFHHGKEGILPSDTVAINLYKVPTSPIDSIILNTLPSEKYPGSGPLSLIDFKKGTSNFRSADWLGFNKNTVRATAYLGQKNVSKIVVSSLVDQGAWIFAPYIISIYKEEKLIATKTHSTTKDQSTNKYHFTELSFEPISTNTIEIQIETLEAIPDWHPGAGSKPWLFLDEILIY